MTVLGFRALRRRVMTVLGLRSLRRKNKTLLGLRALREREETLLGLRALRKREESSAQRYPSFLLGSTPPSLLHPPYTFPGTPHPAPR